MQDGANDCGETTSNKQYVEPSALQRLREKKASLMERLDEVDRALRALDAYPELNGVVDLIRRASR